MIIATKRMVELSEKTMGLQISQEEKLYLMYEALLRLLTSVFSDFRRMIVVDPYAPLAAVNVVEETMLKLLTLYCLVYRDRKRLTRRATRVVCKGDRDIAFDAINLNILVLYYEGVRRSFANVFRGTENGGIDTVEEILSRTLFHDIPSRPQKKVSPTAIIPGTIPPPISRAFAFLGTKSGYDMKETVDSLIKGIAKDLGRISDDTATNPSIEDSQMVVWRRTIKKNVDKWVANQAE